MKIAIRPILKYIIPVLAFLLFLTVFMEIKAHERLNAAREALQTDQNDMAIICYFQAINWYSPVGSSQKAAEELHALAVKLKENGDDALAYQAFLRLRGALNAARSFYIPHKNLITSANTQISQRLAKLKLGESPDPKELERETERYFQIYQNSPVTNELWYLCVLIGFFLWTISALRGIFILFSGEKAPLSQKVKAAKIPIILFVSGYALWLFSMTKA
ncbi:MAG: hypothetical protein LBF22_01425 [Deltaproteobacteria bacterium]|jgi:hypothetical protein|nr:hypothetical protein [Deltaproteobacteria bacterium]